MVAKTGRHLSLALLLLGVVPGMIHAFWVIVKKKEK